MGRLLLRGPRAGAVLRRDSGLMASVPLPEKHSTRAFSPVFKETGWSRGKVLTWLRNWYENRKEGVGVSSQFLRWKEIAVLGPMFFNAFVSDLEKGMSSEMTGRAEAIGLLRFMGTSAS